MSDTPPSHPDDERDAGRGALPRSVLETLLETSGVQSMVSLPPDDESASGLLDPTSVELGSDRRAGQYQLLGELARGGVGIILRGHDVDLGRDVAMKVLRPDHADRPSMIQRFVEEAQIGGQLQHPGIVPVYELGVREDGRPFFTMKLIKGRTLSELLKETREQPGARRRLLSLFVDICQTMAYAHSKGVVHRDLKPSNVMVGAFGEVLVVDWGLAKVLDRGADEARTREELQSQISIIETVRSSQESGGSDSLTGSVLGTPAYMAPEQARGEVETVDQRTDVFALGCLLCEILTGAPPYTGSGKEILIKAAAASLTEAHGWLDHCGADPELIELCKLCLTPARDARPQHAGVVAEQVEAYLGSLEERAQAAVVEAAEARQKRRLTLVGALAVLLLGAGLWWVSDQRAERVRRTDAALERQLGEATALAQAGDLAGALEAVERGEELARAGSASDGMGQALAERRQQLDAALAQRHLLDELAALATDAATATQGELSDETPVDAVLTLRLERLRERDRAFAETFARLGADLRALDLPDAVSLVRQTGVAADLCQALDAWAATRRGLGGLSDPLAERLLQVALAADPQTERMQLRQALLARDGQALRRLAGELDGPALTPVTAHVMGSALIQLDALEEAEVLLRGALRSHRRDLGLNLLLAAALERQGRIEQAVGPLNTALALRPERLLTLLDLASAHLAAADLDLARRVLEDAAALHPEAPEPWVRLAQVHDRRDDVDAEVEALRQAVARDATDRDTLLRLADALHRRGGPDPAMAALRDHAATHAGDPAALLAAAWGVIPSMWGSTEQELELVEQALALDPTSSDGWREATRLRRVLGDLDGALEAIDRALELSPGDPELLRRRGGLRNALAGDARAGLADLRAAVDHPQPNSTAVQWLTGALEYILDQEGDDADLPDDVWLLLARSDRALAAQDIDAAEAFAREAAVREPDLWPARWQLAYVLGKRPAKRDQAIAEYLELIRLRPDHLFARTNVGMRYLVAGELDQALAQFGRAVGFTRHPVRLAHLGEALWRLDRRDEARRLFEESLWRAEGGRSAEVAFAFRTIARCLAIDPESPRSQLLEAERLSSRYAMIYPGREDAHEVQGLVLYRLGELDLARAALERAVDLQPDGVEALTAFLRALVELSAGDRQEGLTWLQRGATQVQELRVADPFVLELVQEAGQLMGG